MLGHGEDYIENKKLNLMLVANKQYICILDFGTKLRLLWFDRTFVSKSNVCAFNLKKKHRKEIPFLAFRTSCFVELTKI